MDPIYEEEEHFNLEMLMRDPAYQQRKDFMDGEKMYENRVKSVIPMHSRIRTKKNRKLILKKKKEQSI